MEIGNWNRMEVTAIESEGIYLTDGLDEALLPARFAPGNVKPGNAIEVFIYTDNDGNKIATTEKPNAFAGDFTYMRVKEVNEHGAFLGWGISKDLFLPYSEQRGALQKGEYVVVFIYVDKKSSRVAATQRWQKHLKEEITVKEGDEVELLIAEESALGYKAIINNSYEGLLYRNEVFEELEPGDRRKGYIRVIRDDGKIDLRLHKEGYAQVEDLKSKILEALKNCNGKLPLGDKSDANQIYSLLGISKKAFKKTIGALYKERKITISDTETKLL